MVLNGVNKISLKKVSTRLSLRNGVLFVPAWVPWVACSRGWRGWRACVVGMGDVLACVAWVGWVRC